MKLPTSGDAFASSGRIALVLLLCCVAPHLPPIGFSTLAAAWVVPQHLPRRNHDRISPSTDRPPSPYGYRPLMQTPIRPHLRRSSGLWDSGNPSQSSSASPAAPRSSSSSSPRLCRARDLILELVQDRKCFSSESGAKAFADACAFNVVYEDRFEPQPIVGPAAVLQHLLKKRVTPRQRTKDQSSVRIDCISDGDVACGFGWTWISGMEEGLRGTTFVGLNPTTGLIEYVQEIPEPLFKPGNLTRELLQAITRGAQPKTIQPFEVQTPSAAHQLARYLYVDLQAADDATGLQELLRFLDPNVVYRDFNFEQPLSGPDEVQQFVKDFTFPGIQFRPLRFDDGIDATCFTWEVVLDGVDDSDTIKGISFYQLDPSTRKIVYVRDVPESAIKPPILGKLARDWRPGLGVFQSVPLGSRPRGW